MTPSVKVVFAYDEEEHYAPPHKISWETRKKHTSNERWIFIQCCGQMGNVEKRGEKKLITSRHPCKGNLFSSHLPATEKHHTGRMVLMRTNHSHIIKHCPPLALWNCCRAELPSWNGRWDSKDLRIPFTYVDTGCKEGRYQFTGCIDSDDDDNDVYDFAMCARPLGSIPKVKSKKSSSGPSSGDQTFVIENEKLMNPGVIKFTQQSVLKTFTDPLKPSLLDAMQQIFDGEIEIDDFPSIRVATRDNTTSIGGFYTCDNRRLLMFKVLRIKKIYVQWIGWTSEFDDKLRQNIKIDPETRVATNDEGIVDFRDDFIDDYCEHSVLNHGDSLFYIPEKFAGYLIGTEGRTIKAICRKRGTHITIRELSKSHRVNTFTDVMKISYSQDTESRKEYVPGDAKKEHVKMVRKLARRNYLEELALDACETMSPI